MTDVSFSNHRGLATLGDKQKILQEHVTKYPSHVEKLTHFFDSFSSEEIDDGLWGKKKYRNLLQGVYSRRSKVLPVYIDDLKTQFETSDEGLLNGVLMNTRRYMELMYDAADRVIRSDTFEQTFEDNNNMSDSQGMHSCAFKWERRREEEMARSQVPPHLRVPFQIIIVPSAKDCPRKMRSVNADYVGCLCKFEADVVRVTQLKPRLQVACYECDKCHKFAYKAVDGPTFMPLFDCPACTAQHNLKGSLKFHLKLSKFIKYQEVKVQEPANQVPQGDVPRSLNCIVTGENTKFMQPGMSVTLTGILMPVAKFGYAALRSGLIAEQVFEVQHAVNNKKGFSEDMEDSVDILRQVEEAKQQEGLYERLAYSIAPEIWGHEDVKKALLLQLIGGCTKEKKDGGLIRGDIHVLLMGDPGVAKSQLLKKVCSIAPRSVYTTGKGSSSVGMTAAIVKDPNTGETTLEGGALVLADQGMCCIDEFDKMDEYDRSAIYEVMEQQTVSIAKAGHCSSMPARAAVLAAANPVDGRYDLRKSVMANMNLPAALLTRFDLQFLMVDRADRENDIKLAKHVLGVMRNLPLQETRNTNNNNRNNSHNLPPLDKKVIRCFIAKAKDRTPVLADGLVPQITDWYVATRQTEASLETRVADSRVSYTTPRALLGILRLSQALARLRDSDLIEAGDFEEALRLCMESKRSILMRDEGRKRARDTKTEVIELLKRMKARMVNSRSDWSGWIPLAEVEQQLLVMGLKKMDLENALKTYEELSVIILNSKKTAVGFPEDVNNASSDEEAEKNEGDEPMHRTHSQEGEGEEEEDDDTQHN